MKTMSKNSIIMLALLVLCNCEDSRRINDKYYYQEFTTGGTGAILENSNFIVYPDIVEYRIGGKYVIGRRELAKDNMDPSDKVFTAGLGWFVLNTETGALVQGLSRAEAEALLRKNFRA